MIQKNMDVQTNASPRTAHWIKALAAVVVLLIAAIGYFFLSSPQAVPDVSFTSLSGEKITSQSLRGKVEIGRAHV